MKKLIIASGLGLLWFANASFAQSCATAPTLQSGGTFSGDTCSASVETGIGSFCGGVNPTGNIAVFTWPYGGGARAGTITVTPTQGGAGYDVALGVVRGTCSSTGTCVTTADSAQSGTTAESVDLTTAPFNTSATYFLFVTSLGDGTTGGTCGTFNGTVGTLPVKLQSFSIN